MNHAPSPASGDLSSSTRLEPGSIYSDGTYISNNQTWHAEDSPWKASQIMRLLQRNGVQPATVCEVGCGAGEILRQLSLQLPETRFVGYERSPQANALNRLRGSPRISFRTTDIFEDSDVHDCLLCIDVFEHVRDYMGFLTELRTKARLKVFHVPLDISVLSVLHSSMMRARQSAGHLHYFTHETALATLADCGYRVIDGFFTTPFSGLAVKGWKSRLARLPRRLLFSISPALAAKLVGGCSYIVLAE